MNSKKKKTIAALLILLVSLLFSSYFVSANTTVPKIKVNLNDFVTPAGEEKPYINKDRRTMVPVRFLSTSLGVFDDSKHIKWDPHNSTVSIYKEKINILIQVGNKNLTINNKTVEMDTKAELKNGRVYIPLRYIAEALGSRIMWDKQNNEINIFTDWSNNFLQYNLVNITNGFPVSINGDGFTLGINDAIIYSYDSEDSSFILNKYGLKPENEGTPYYLIWMSVTLANSGTKIVESTNETIPFSFGFNPTDLNSLVPLKPKAEFDVINNPEILNKWHLELDQKIDSHIALILTQKDIKRFFVKTNKEETTIAIRQS